MTFVLKHNSPVDEIMVEWEAFANRWPYEFRQGHHVTLIGPTGSGKTLLAQELVKIRSNVVALGIKHRDDSMRKLMGQGWTRITKWENRPRNASKLVLWPKESDINKVQAVHKEVFGKMLANIYRDGGWCVWTDELRYMTDMIGMRKAYQLMYVAGRSNNVSLVSAAQRPSHVPLEAYSQAQHLILFRTGDERDLVRLGGLNGNNARQIASMVAALPHHHFLHVNLNDGSHSISTLKV